MTEQDTRQFDKTQLHMNRHADQLGRDFVSHFFRWSYVKRYVKPTDHIIEIGCGQDKPLQKLLFGGSGRLISSYTGVDLNKFKYSNTSYCTFFSEFNAIDRYNELLEHRPEKYDVLVTLEVIEHMSAESGAQLLDVCNRLLKMNGIMLISTPCYDGRRQAKNHIHEFYVDELNEYIINSGFEIQTRFGTFMDIKHIGKANTGNEELDRSIKVVHDALYQYYSNDALSNIFAPLYPDHARNNIWICKKISEIE